MLRLQAGQTGFTVVAAMLFAPPATRQLGGT
jgi:hypothetical protein